MDALPFCSLALKSQKPLPEQYPKEINSLGDHLRKRRLDLGLLQREVAEKIGVDESTIYNWERQRTVPEIRFIARIIEFLGYDPIKEPESFGEKLKIRRLKLGLSQRKLATIFGIDPGTLGSWEGGRHKPTKESRELIDRLFSGEVSYRK
jgi:transcriptional regulator with XRE-family HTH domain